MSLHLERADDIGDCARLFLEVDGAVAAAQVADAQSQRIRGFPYLRVNRLLASYAPDDMAPSEFDAWAAALAALDEDARNVELENLPATTELYVDKDTLAACREALLNQDLADARTRSRLSEQARTVASYSGAKRVLGLYPLTSIAMRFGVGRLNKDTAARFRLPLAELPVEGALVRFEAAQSASVLTADEVAVMLHTTSENELNIASPNERQLAQLFQTFAPVWEIDVSTDDDRIGRPSWVSGQLSVDVAQPTMYTLVSHTRLAGEIALQLNYVVWFPARPLRNGIDLLGGVLDGITWRVTLAGDGRPIFYDAMHNCGCYYMAFPTGRVQQKAKQSGFDEPIAVPQRVDDGDGPLVIRLQTGSHYLSRVYRGADTSNRARVALKWSDYDELRSLPGTDGRRSLFASDGLVTGSERGERWLFWPMGIAEPGAMRQWGNHAIAFVGKRHFDDPDLIDRHFRIVPAD